MKAIAYRLNARNYYSGRARFSRQTELRSSTHKGAPDSLPLGRKDALRLSYLTSAHSTQTGTGSVPETNAIPHICKRQSCKWVIYVTIVKYRGRHFCEGCRVTCSHQDAYTPGDKPPESRPRGNRHERTDSGLQSPSRRHRTTPTA